MVQPKENDPIRMFAAFFGTELRRYRTDAGLTQERLGELTFCSGAQVSLIEAAKRTPTPEFAGQCDEILKTGGALARILPNIRGGGLPSWFRGFAELESMASNIRIYEVQNVTGLLQTEGYARALLLASRSEDVDELVAARLERQSILTRPTPPMLWIILDEAVLRRRVGDRATMHEQLKQLAEHVTSPRIVLQVLPFDAGAHACSDGAMTILSFEEGGPDAVYAEGAGTAQLVNQPDQVARCQVRYDLVRAAALSPEASADVILRAMESYDEPEH